MKNEHARAHGSGSHFSVQIALRLVARLVGTLSMRQTVVRLEGLLFLDGK